MKNLTLLFVMAFVISIATKSQAQNIGIGAKAGVNVSNFNGYMNEDLEPFTSFHLGGYASISISERLQFQPELLFSVQGAKYKGYDEKYRLNYFNIPLLLKFYPVEGLHLQAGPQLSIGTSAKELEDDGDIDDIDEDFEDTDFGLVFGAGYELASGLNFGARYNLGLSNIYTYSDGGDEDMNNRVIQIWVGYTFKKF